MHKITGFKMYSKCNFYGNLRKSYLVAKVTEIHGVLPVQGCEPLEGEGEVPTVDTALLRVLVQKRLRYRRQNRLLCREKMDTILIYCSVLWSFRYKSGRIGIILPHLDPFLQKS
jgi:hypothetical protein